MKPVRAHAHNLETIVLDRDLLADGELYPSARSLLFSGKRFKAIRVWIHFISLIAIAPTHVHANLHVKIAHVDGCESDIRFHHNSSAIFYRAAKASPFATVRPNARLALDQQAHFPAARTAHRSSQNTGKLLVARVRHQGLRAGPGPHSTDSHQAYPPLHCCECLPMTNLLPLERVKGTV